MIVRRTLHGLCVDFSVTARTIVREGHRNRFLIVDIMGMTSVYMHPSIEHFVCPKHMPTDYPETNVTPCATIEVMTNRQGGY